MHKLKPANKVQRIFAAFMDLMIAFLLATLLSSFIVNPLFVNSTSYK